MIKIGNTLINPAEISAIYPSESTAGKVWISLRSGRTVWTMASMEDVTRALQDAGELDDTETPEELKALKIMLNLYAQGFRYIARDENGVLFAFTDKPVKDECCWGVSSGDAIPLDGDPFIGIQWEDDEPEDIACALALAGYEVELRNDRLHRRQDLRRSRV